MDMNHYLHLEYRSCHEAGHDGAFGEMPERGAWLRQSMNAAAAAAPGESLFAVAVVAVLGVVAWAFLAFQPMPSSVQQAMQPLASAQVQRS